MTRLPKGTSDGGAYPVGTNAAKLCQLVVARSSLSQVPGFVAVAEIAETLKLFWSAEICL
jgi:hypothetical protein